MLRDKALLIGKLVILTDFLLICASYLFSKLVFSIQYDIPFGVVPFEADSVIAASCLILFCLYLNDVYSSMRKKTYRTIAREVIFAHVQAGMLVAMLMFTVKLVDSSRQLVMVYFLCSIFLVLSRRAVAKFALARFRAAGHNLRNILIVGATLPGRKYARLLKDYKHLGYRVAGFLSNDENDMGRLVRWTGSKVVGRIDDLDSYLKANPIDEVVFAVNDNDLSWKKMQVALLICEEYGVKMSILPAFFNLQFAKMKLEEVGELNLITFVTHNNALLPRMAKQLIDTLVSAFMLWLIGPFIAVIAIIIKFDSRGPVFFVQKRCGLNGRVFNFLKFRSMYTDAEERKHELLRYNEMSGPIFKIRNDPRITRVGRWLRKYSIDEWPQLINVFKGDMSLVGPRPPVPSEVEKYERWQRRRLSVKPGITCLWQVSGRNNIDFEDWMKLDLKYIDNWSLKLDLELLLKTVPAVINGSGM